MALLMCAIFDKGPESAIVPTIEEVEMLKIAPSQGLAIEGILQSWSSLPS